VADEARGGVAHHDRAGLRHLLQARRQGGGVADRGVVHAEVVANGADHDEPDVKAHAQAEEDRAAGRDLERLLGERAPDAERRQHRPARMVLVAERAPNRAMKPSPRNWLTVPS
jgi:hypothetical protein